MKSATYISPHDQIDWLEFYLCCDGSNPSKANVFYSVGKVLHFQLLPSPRCKWEAVWDVHTVSKQGHYCWQQKILSAVEWILKALWSHLERCNVIMLLSLRGNCTLNSNLSWFVPYLKFMYTFFFEKLYDYLVANCLRNSKMMWKF